MRKAGFLYKAAAWLCMLALIIPSVYAAETVGYDIQKPETEIAVLDGLGLIEAADYQTEGRAFTRGELAQKLLPVLNLTDMPWDESLPFRDVPSKHDNYAAIGKCVSAGILNGYGSTSFKPEQASTTGEAVTALMRALGYRNIAEKKGGYSTGYLVQAQASGLLKGISSEAVRQTCTDWIFAKLVYNMLTVKVYSVVGVENGEPVIERGEAYMTATFNLKKASGVLEATRVTDIESGKALHNEFVKIGGVRYRNGGAKLDQYLGYGAEFYYVEALGEEPIILYAEFDDDESCVKKIAKDDVTELRSNSIRYLLDDKEKTVSIPRDAYLLYNNLPVSDLTEIQTDGYYICIDNDGDGDIDVVRIEEYTNLFVDSVNRKDGKIYDTYSGSNNLSFAPDDVGKSVFLYDEKGNEIDLSGVKTNMVYSCVRSAGDEIIVARAIISEVFGLLGSVTTDANGYYDTMVIGEDEVTVAVGLKPHISDVTVGKSTLIGYCDVMGKLAAYTNAGSSGKKFAYLRDVKIKSGVGGDIQVQMHVAGSGKGVFGVYEPAASIKVDEAAYKLSKDKATLLSTLSAVKGQIITFELNSEEKLSSVGTIGGGSLKRVAGGTSDVFYSSRLGNMGVAASTVVFFVPPSGSESEFDSGTRSILTNESSYTNYEGWVTDDDVVAAEVMVTDAQENATTLNVNAPHMIVTDVSTTVDSEGIECKKVRGYVLGTLQSFTLNDDTKCFTLKGDAITEVKTGDVIRYSAANGVFGLVQLLYSLDGDVRYFTGATNNTSLYAKPRVLRVKAYKKHNEFLLMALKDPAEGSFNAVNDCEMRSLDSCRAVYVYDKNALQPITIGSKDDIQTYWKQGSACDDLFVVTRGTMMETVVIIKK